MSDQTAFLLNFAASFPTEEAFPFAHSVAISKSSLSTLPSLFKSPK
jgi:hypothetical protein